MLSGTNPLSWVGPTHSLPHVFRLHHYSIGLEIGILTLSEWKLSGLDAGAADAPAPPRRHKHICTWQDSYSDRLSIKSTPLALAGQRTGLTLFTTFCSSSNTRSIKKLLYEQARGKSQADYPFLLNMADPCQLELILSQFISRSHSRRRGFWN